MICLNRAEALRYLGWAGQPLDDELQQRFNQLADTCEQELSPQWAYASFRIDEAHTFWQQEASTPAQVALVGTPLVLLGSDIANHLQGAGEVALLACTLGAESERALRRLNATSPTDALMYGAAASALVEAAADVAEAELAVAVRSRGLFAGGRFSPGYGDMPLTVQPAFVQALDATRRIGLSVTADNFLVPSKSITAVVGLFEDAQQASAARVCDCCQRVEECLLKAQGGTCHG